MNIQIGRLVPALLVAFGASALAQQPAPSWGGDTKSNLPAKTTGQSTTSGQSGTRPPPPPPPPSSGQSSGTSAPPPLPPGIATQTGPVTFIAYGTFDATGAARHVTGGSGTPTSEVVGRNIASVQHEGTGRYLVRLRPGSPAAVCVASFIGESPTGRLDSSCVAKTYPAGIAVNCVTGQGTGYVTADMPFSIICVAP